MGIASILHKSTFLTDLHTHFKDEYVYSWTFATWQGLLN